MSSLITALQILRIAIYIRVSTSMQVKDNLSLEDQLNSLTKWAAENGHEIIKVYEDAGSSAFKGVRNGFENLLSDITSKKIKIDCVAVYDTSRFSRNEYNRLRAENIFENNNIRLYSLIDCIPEDPDSARLYKALTGAFNEEFSRKNSKKSALKLNDAAKQGFFTGGTVPFGYQSVPVPNTTGGKQRKTLEIYPENAKIVKKIFSLYLAGEYGLTYGVKRIASYLNEKNILKNNKPWTENSVHLILNNPIYMGKREFGHNRIRKDLHDEIIIIPTPVIISKENFQLAQKTLRSKAPQINTNKASVNNESQDKGLQSPKLLTGLLKCAKCGCNLVMNYGKSGQYEYYKCRDKIKQSIKVCNCPTFPKKKIEDAITNSLKGFVFNSSYINSIYDEIKITLTQKKKDNSLEKASLQHKWNAVDRQVSKLFNDIAEEKLEMSSMISRHLKVYEERLNSLQKDIDDLDRRSRLPLMNFGKHQIDNFVSACEKVLLGGNTEATKALLMATVKDIKVYEDKIDITGGNLKLLANVANNKAGNPNGVPSLISIWR